jgi:hypothetical protein
LKRAVMLAALAVIAIMAGMATGSSMRDTGTPVAGVAKGTDISYSPIQTMGSTASQSAVSPNGQSWSTVADAPMGAHGVWAKYSDVFAVRGHFIMHYDGISWNTSEIEPDDKDVTLHDIWGTSYSDVFAVGYCVVEQTESSAIILHYDGASWTTMPNPGASNLFDIWGTSPSDVFAVGCGPSSGMVLHYDGASWNIVSTEGAADLYGVWGSSATDVFAVGYDKILHYNGTKWSEMSHSGTFGLNGVWGSSHSDVFAVGESGTILHYDGISWSNMSSGTNNRLKAIWGSSATNMFAVGDTGTILHYDGADDDGDGSLWDAMSSGTRIGLDDIWGAASLDVFAVGYGIFLHYGDAVPPAAVADLAATAATADSVSLTWTAPGDDASRGTASAYDIRYSMTTITDASWGAASRCSTEPTPSTAGSTETHAVTGLSAETTYYFALKTADEVPNWSSLSNIASTQTLTEETTPPTVITTGASSITTSSARLNGDLTALGSADTVTVSFVWGGTMEGPYPNETTGVAMSAPGSFHFDLGSLTPGTTYYYLAKAAGDDTSYGGEEAFITGLSPEVEDVSPDRAKRNQHLTVTITGANFDGATVVSFGPGIGVEDLDVNSSTEITAEIVIDASAAKGPRDVSVTTGWGTVTKTDGFRVTGGGGGICSGGVPVAPGASSELTTVLAALGLLSGLGYLLVRRGTTNRRANVES